MSRFFTILCLAVLWAVVVQARADEMRLWLYIPTNHLVTENVENNIAMIQRAAKVGYNGVLLADSKFSRRDELPKRYDENVKRFREECRRLKMELYVAVCPIGYSNDFLSQDPNLAEALPVVDAPFVIQNGKLVPEPPAEPILKNGGFEDVRKTNHPAGWNFIDGPGEISFIDTEVKIEGNASLRFQDIGPEEPRNGRAMQKLAVKPFHYYHVSMMVKTEDFDSTANMYVTILGEDGMSLNWHMPPVGKTQDWKRLDVTFNSLENSSVNFYFGTWGGRRGKVWFDDVRIEPAGFVNLVRRDGAPLTIRTERGAPLLENKNFGKIVDPLLGNDPYGGCFTAWHAPPTIKVYKGCPLKEGARVLVSYYHTSIIYGEQVGCCMAEPKTREFLQWQIKRMAELAEPDGYFMSHDEMRQAGWDKSCVDSGKTPAELLADNVAFCVETIRKTDPGKPIAVWSDMFDPMHNAKKDGHYYLVKGKGPWYGSWNGLPKDVMIGNWNSNPKTRKDSLKHFADRGNPQILAGYYDGEPVEKNIRDWLRDAAETPGLRGVIYTTWRNDFKHLERFAEAAKEEWNTKP